MPTAKSRKGVNKLEPVTENGLNPIDLLSRDLARVASTMSANEARFLVGQYYKIQEDRKRSDSQVAELSKNDQPHAVMSWLLYNNETFEKGIAKALDVYSASSPMGEWLRSIFGIGPVIAAGLLAHINIDKVKHASGIWRYAGLDPTSEWKKGQKRPWNAELKVLCWKIGESFMKQSGNEKCYYGHLIKHRWEIEKSMNRDGKFQEQAKLALERKKIGQDTEAFLWYNGYLKAEILDGYTGLTLEQRNVRLKDPRYNVGEGRGTPMLPPAHILARAKRWAVKQFLCDYFMKECEIKGRRIARPYALTMGLPNHTTLRLGPGVKEPMWIDEAASAQV